MFRPAQAARTLAGERVALYGLAQDARPHQDGDAVAFYVIHAAQLARVRRHGQRCRLGGAYLAQGRTAEACRVVPEVAARAALVGRAGDRVGQIGSRSGCRLGGRSFSRCRLLHSLGDGLPRVGLMVPRVH
ncbi:hypothetical protein D3C85_1432690 [compost metagenome]